MAAEPILLNASAGWNGESVLPLKSASPGGMRGAIESEVEIKRSINVRWIFDASSTAAPLLNHLPGPLFTPSTPLPLPRLVCSAASSQNRIACAQSVRLWCPLVFVALSGQPEAALSSLAANIRRKDQKRGTTNEQDYQ